MVRNGWTAQLEYRYSVPVVTLGHKPHALQGVLFDWP